MALRGTDIIGQALMNALNDLGSQWGQKITADRAQEKQQGILSGILNRKTEPQYQQSGQYPSGPIEPGQPVNLQMQDVGSQPISPFDQSNVGALAQLNPQTLGILQATQPKYVMGAPGSGIVEEKLGQVPRMVGQIPEKAPTLQHITVDAPDERGNPVTREVSKGIVEKRVRNIDIRTGQQLPGFSWVKVDDLTGSAAGKGGAGKWMVQKGPMGETLGWYNPDSRQFVKPSEVGVPNPTPLTTTTKSMIEAAPKVKRFIDTIKDIVDKEASGLGPIGSRWQEFMAGKVGSPNPEYTKLRTNVGLLTTLLMRMHVGARGGEYIMDHFRGLFDAAKQSPENLKAALDEAYKYADDVLEEGRVGVDLGGKTQPQPPQKAPEQKKVGKFTIEKVE